MDPSRAMDRAQNQNAQSFDNFYSKNKTSVKLMAPPGIIIIFYYNNLLYKI